MINRILALPAGSALRLFLSPPPGAQWWRVLRRSSGPISGPADPGAAVVADRTVDTSILDAAGGDLADGTTYTYQAFYWDGSAFWPSNVVTGTPAATYGGDAPDPQMLVRDRLALGLAVEVARGALKPATGRIPVVTAPFAMTEGISFPCVSVHLDSDAPTERAIGETVYSDFLDPDSGDFTEHEGWLSRVSLNVVGVSLNPDERIALRRAIRRVIIANLPVLEDAGLQQVQFAQRDSERLGGEDQAPLYLTSGTFECLAPAFVTGDAGVIADVVLTAHGEVPNG